MASNKVYDWVTERIVKQLESGTIPWRCPWVTGGASMNFVTKKPYRGMNVFMTAMSGFASPYWMTRKQILSKGGRIRKGEKATMVVFWKVFDREPDENGKSRKSFVLRYYNVWNVEQTDGIDYPKPETTQHDPIVACETIIDGYVTCPEIAHKGNRAYYKHSDDSITMPPMEYFTETPEYYSTLFHEAAHSTGHESRLGRKMGASGFGSESYSFEELVAEMTAAMLCGQAGIEMATLENSAAYIASWLKKFKSDTTMLVKAASKAQKAADYILGVTWGDKSVTPTETIKAEAVAVAA